MKSVGKLDRSDLEPDPQRAWQRGRQLDALWRAQSSPRPRGVWRMTFAQMNRDDLERQLAQAARINRAER